MLYVEHMASTSPFLSPLLCPLGPLDIFIPTSILYKHTWFHMTTLKSKNHKWEKTHDIWFFGMNLIFNMIIFIFISFPTNDRTLCLFMALKKILLYTCIILIHSLSMDTWVCFLVIVNIAAVRVYLWHDSILWVNHRSSLTGSCGEENWTPTEVWNQIPDHLSPWKLSLNKSKILA